MLQFFDSSWILLISFWLYFNCIVIFVQNMPVESKMEDEIIRVPVRSPTEPAAKPPPDETAVWARRARHDAKTLWRGAAQHRTEYKLDI